MGMFVTAPSLFRGLVMTQQENYQESVPGLGVGSGGTAQYVSMHDSSGELVVACADMSVIEEEFEVDHKASVAVYDCNLSPKTVSKALTITSITLLSRPPMSRPDVLRDGVGGVSTTKSS